MRAMIGEMLAGRPAYASDTPWGPVGALAKVTAISLLCQYLLPLCLCVASPEVYAKASGYLGPPRLWGSSYSPSFVLLIQVAMFGLIWLASGMRGGDRGGPFTEISGGWARQNCVNRLPHMARHRSDKFSNRRVF
jgi:hypothetical protein